MALYDCLSANISRNTQSSNQFFSARCVWHWLGPPLASVQYAVA